MNAEIHGDACRSDGAQRGSDPHSRPNDSTARPHGPKEGPNHMEGGGQSPTPRIGLSDQRSTART